MCSRQLKESLLPSLQNGKKIFFIEKLFNQGAVKINDIIAEHNFYQLSFLHNSFSVATGAVCWYFNLFIINYLRWRVILCILPRTLCDFLIFKFLLQFNFFLSREPFIEASNIVKIFFLFLKFLFIDTSHSIKIDEFV